MDLRPVFGTLVGLAVVAFAATAAPNLASADMLRDNVSGGFTEQAHDVRITFDRGFATLRVRRTVVNEGAEDDQADWILRVPELSVATGLRILGRRKGQPHWFAAALRDAEAATTMYAAQHEPQLGARLDAALLTWASPQDLELHAFPCRANVPKTVEYTLRMPATYTDGRYVVTLPPLGLDESPANVQVVSAHPADTIRVDGVELEAHTRLVARSEMELSLTPVKTLPILSQLGVIAAGDRYLVRYELAIAPQLSRTPSGLATVIVIDTSASIGAAALGAELEAARAYLRNLDRPKLGATAAIVTFDRTARVLGAGMRPVEETLRALEDFDPDRRNGSNVDRALTVAQGLLRRIPNHRRRVVIMSDAAMRSQLTPVAVGRAIQKTRATTHVASLGAADDPMLERDSEHPWRDAARRSGGLGWFADASSKPAATDAMTQTFLAWVRPTQIHDAFVSARELDNPLAGAVDIPQGFGAATLAIQDRPVRQVTFHGELWSRPVTVTTRPSKTFGRAWAALALAAPLASDLSDAEVRGLARRGGAVSRLTSYVTAKPGTRPSLEDWGSQGWGTVCCGHAGTLGVGVGTGSGGHRESLDLPEFLRTAIRQRAEACGLSAETAVQVELETTFEEIVAINTVKVGGDATGRECVREALWSLSLPNQFDDDRKIWRVDG